jgi:hypothetical protein
MNGRIGAIRFLADDLMIFLQTKEREKALDALLNIFRITMDYLKYCK